MTVVVARLAVVVASLCIEPPAVREDRLSRAHECQGRECDCLFHSIPPVTRHTCGRALRLAAMQRAGSRKSSNQLLHR